MFFGYLMRNWTAKRTHKWTENGFSFSYSGFKKRTYGVKDNFWWFGEKLDNKRDLRRKMDS